MCQAKSRAISFSGRFKNQSWSEWPETDLVFWNSWNWMKFLKVGKFCKWPQPSKQANRTDACTNRHHSEKISHSLSRETARLKMHTERKYSKKVKTYCHLTTRMVVSLGKWYNIDLLLQCLQCIKILHYVFCRCVSFTVYLPKTNSSYKLKIIFSTFSITEVSSNLT